MKKFALLLTILIFTAARAQDLPAYTCFKTNTPPTIDGTADDAVWQQAMLTDLVDVEDLTRTGDRSLPPVPGDQWRMNFYRYERIRVDGEEIEIEFNAWSPVGRIDFHVPERFGIVTFADAPTAVEAASWGAVKRQR